MIYGFMVLNLHLNKCGSNYTLTDSNEKTFKSHINPFFTYNPI